MSFLLDYLYPPRCLACGELGEPFCGACREQIARYDPETGCPGSLAGVRSAGLYEGPLRSAVIQLKFHRKVALVRPLGELLAAELDCVRQEWRPDFLAPVPIHWTRRLGRGFNQCELLAQELSRRSGLSTLPALRRTRPTPSQRGLSARERSTNVVGAFEADPCYPVEHRRLLLIDDVWTTGSTLREGALALQNAGADVVFALTVTYDA